MRSWWGVAILLLACGTPSSEIPPSTPRDAAASETGPSPCFLRHADSICSLKPCFFATSVTDVLSASRRTRTIRSPVNRLLRIVRSGAAGEASSSGLPSDSKSMAPRPMSARSGCRRARRTLSDKPISQCGSPRPVGVDRVRCVITTVRPETPAVGSRQREESCAIENSLDIGPKASSRHRSRSLPPCAV
jgi:hypothetical protein